MPGYSLVLADKDGKQTGYVHFTGPGSATTKLSWPRTDKGWSEITPSFLISALSAANQFHFYIKIAEKDRDQKKNTLQLMNATIEDTENAMAIILYCCYNKLPSLGLWHSNLGQHNIRGLC